ncbi:DUF1129 domain-containing protein [Vagococcus carniphilus]|uniref:DUF1129 domain-containing protein n=1 Tax=Vagococcus carniphilus TaxID=218144 RepID=A0A430ASM6_9ENTE|nr:DUF1129 family protein [Vagococcus carniphilus]QNN73202.1 DUF1129 domain-containing protein [Vagococcus carniphilus]RSU11069.1 hypothetical protein CBF28_12520 [Vagococcus carniphilus]
MEETREELQQKVAQNRELMTQLTKKNDQFIFDINKVLETSQLEEEKKVRELNTMLVALVEGQKTGVTAKQLYGTPTEAADAIINAPEPAPEMTFGKIMLDNFLLLFTILSVMVSLFGMFSRTGQQTTQGITAIVLGAASGAFSFYLIYRYIYVYDQPGADASKRPGFLKTSGIMALSFIPWFIVFALASFLPANVNPVLDPMLTISLGVATYGIRYWLKKKFRFESVMFAKR